MWSTKVHTIILFIYVLFSTKTVQAQSDCTTPNGEAATCISINSCKILYNAVGTTNSQQLSFLRASQCGLDQGPLVCCGSYDNYKPRSRRRTTTSRPSRNQRQGWGWENYEDVDEETEPSSTQDRNSGGNSIFPDRSRCGIQEGDRILNGQATGLTEFPWMALLQYRKRNGALTFSCGGTLISSRYVLTAAHCVQGQIISKIGPLVNVRLGEYNTDTEQDCTTQYNIQVCNNKPVDSGVEQALVHPDYKDTNANRPNDIALLKLKKEIPYNDFIKPICLPLKTERSSVGDNLIVAGWGRTEYANSSPVKLKLRVPIAEASRCSKKFKSAGVTLEDRQLCAGGELNRDSCQGDSGGPLMATTKNDSAQWYIEGIVSFGAKCGSEGWPGIYTRVSEYVDWIRSNAR